MLINSKQFNFQFFLSDRKKVKSLKAGALQHGGATKFNDAIYANVAGNEYIQIKEKDNEISIFIPSTLSVNKKVNNEYYIKYAINYLTRYYNRDAFKYYDTKGSWYSEDLKKVVYDNITIITVDVETITENDIYNFIELAKWIKKEMSQEGVSITINTALAIV